MRKNSANQPKKETHLLKTHSACCTTEAGVYPKTLGKRSNGLKRLLSRGMREPKSTSARCISTGMGLRKASRWRCSGLVGRQRNEMLWLSRNLGACTNG